MSLNHIAADLRREADRKPGHTHNHTLPCGLKLSLYRQGERMTLAVRRFGVFPGKAECEIVTAAFRVPTHTEQREMDGQRQKTIYWIWEEAIPPAQPAARQENLL